MHERNIKLEIIAKYLSPTNPGITTLSREQRMFLYKAALARAAYMNNQEGQVLFSGLLEDETIKSIADKLDVSVPATYAVRKAFLDDIVAHWNNTASYSPAEMTARTEPGFFLSNRFYSTCVHLKGKSTIELQELSLEDARYLLKQNPFVNHIRTESFIHDYSRILKFKMESYKGPIAYIPGDVIIGITYLGRWKESAAENTITANQLSLQLITFTQENV